jgi:SAM-dependent methyltransferase
VSRLQTVDRCRAVIAALCLIVSTAQAAQSGFEPRVGQAGKDVIWVPTPNSLIDRMLRMANVGPGDRVVDLGSGDGRIAIAAARDFNVPATGIEFNPDMVTLSNRNAVDQGVSQRVKFVQGDIFEADFSEATVITMYLLPSLNLRLRPRLLAMKPGTRIVSHAFTMDDWQPDSTVNVEGQNAYFWIVPAQVGGTWRVQIGTETIEVKLAQQFQNFRGAAGPAGSAVTGFLRGDEIRMTLPDGRGGRRDLVGKVAGEQMTGTAGSQPFTAQRTALPTGQ